MDFDSFKEQCIRIDEKMSAAQIEKKRRDIGPRSNSAPVSTHPSPITPAVRPPFIAPTISPNRFPIAGNLPTPAPRPSPIVPGDPPIDWEIEGRRISEKEKQWRRDNRRCLICRSPDHQFAVCPNKRDRPIVNDRAVRGTTVLEEEKGGSARVRKELPSITSLFPLHLFPPRYP